jgi:uncharacterized protein (DUF4415 family)
VRGELETLIREQRNFEGKAGHDGVSDSAKVRVTIALDRDIVARFKAEAGKPGALPYQTQINQALRRVIFGEDAGTEAVKAALLTNEGFLTAVADAVNRRHLA